MITIRRRWIFGPLHNGSWGAESRPKEGPSDRGAQLSTSSTSIRTDTRVSHWVFGGPPLRNLSRCGDSSLKSPFGQQWGQQGGDEERTHQRVLKQTYKENREMMKSETSERRRIGGEKIKERKPPILSFSPHTVTDKPWKTIQLALHRRRRFQLTRIATAGAGSRPNVATDGIGTGSRGPLF